MPRLARKRFYEGFRFFFAAPTNPLAETGVGIVREDFMQLKAGDEVFRSGGWSDAVPMVVERVTATQIVLRGSPTKYRRRDGCAVGDTGYRRGCLLLATDELKADVAEKARRQQALRTCEDTRFRDLSTDALVDIAAAITKAT